MRSGRCARTGGGRARRDSRPGRPRARHVGRRPRGRARLRVAGQADEALALLEGAIPPGLDDEWALEAQDEHRDRLVSLLEELASAAARNGELREAVALTRRQAALEPLLGGDSPRAHAPARRRRRSGHRPRRVHGAPEPARHPPPDRAVTGDAAARRRDARRSCRRDAGGVSGAPAPRRPDGVRRPHVRARPHRGRLAARHRRRGRRAGRPARRRGGDREVEDHGALRGRSERSRCDRSLWRV